MWQYDYMPFVHFKHWRRSGPYVSLLRSQASLVIEDTLVANMFAVLCKAPCIPSEHYFASLLAYHGREDETTCEGSTVTTHLPAEGAASTLRSQSELLGMTDRIGCWEV